MDRRKNYGLTNKTGENFKDKAPDWMDDFFKGKFNKKEKKHPFEGIEDPILNPNNIGVKKEKKE